MNKRPDLDLHLDSKTFKEYYYLKEELIDFCRKNDLQTSGTKSDLTEIIAVFLDTGKRTCKKHIRKTSHVNEINTDTVIEKNFICSQKHRTFFEEQIGKSFSFNVSFQKWLKNNSGKTYKDAITAYYEIIDDKKKNKSTIGKQFEYNQYIRDFFEDNNDKNMKQAIKCWKYKKSLRGPNNYEKDDLKIL